MKYTQLFEEFINEGKSFEFTFNYNTDEDDVEYIQNILMDSGADAIAEPGLDSEEMVVKAKNAVELRKAKKAIQADGFEINESVVNEGISELIVYPSSKADHQKIANWLPKSDWHAEEENNYFSFEVSGRKDADSTEKELDKEFAKLGANVRYELQESQTFVDESKISEIFLMANYAKSFTAFRKEFMNEFGKPKTVKELQQIEAWLQTIWNNREVQTSEGFANEAKSEVYPEEVQKIIDGLTGIGMKKYQLKAHNNYGVWFIELPMTNISIRNLMKIEKFLPEFTIGNFPGYWGLSLRTNISV
jgi:hypothetical protein